LKKTTAYFIGKTVVITGASSGIGEALALVLAKMNTKLVLIARREDRLKVLAEKVRSSGSQAFVRVADLLKDDAVVLGESLWKEYGDLDVLINCAGILETVPYETLAPERIAELFRVNVLGPLLLTRVFYPHFRKKKSGHFIHVASLTGITALPYYQVYAATKHAIVGFSKAFEYELTGTGIRQTCARPGAVRTEQITHLVDFASETKSTMHEPREAAELILKAAARGKRLYKLGFINRLLTSIGVFFPFVERPILMGVAKKMRKTVFKQ
jgi:hypothetical protein